MKDFLVMNEFGAMVVDIFAQWLNSHKFGDIDNPNPIHNETPIDIFDLALIGIIYD